MYVFQAAHTRENAVFPYGRPDGFRNNSNPLRSDTAMALKEPNHAPRAQIMRRMPQFMQRKL